VWKTPDGRANTVALADPTSAMTKDFVESIVRLAPEARGELAELVDRAQDEFFDVLDDIEFTELTDLEEDGLPAQYLHGSFDSAEDVALYLNQINVRWRLDALLAVEDIMRASTRPDPARSLLAQFFNRFRR
jgi:hypothetical protein